MFTEFKLEYIAKDKRLNSSYEGDPPWKNKIKEILNRLSELIDAIENLVPSYSSQAPEEWTPFWIAVLEIQTEFNLPGEDWETEYKINRETNEITLAEEE